MSIDSGSTQWTSTRRLTSVMVYIPSTIISAAVFLLATIALFSPSSTLLVVLSVLGFSAVALRLVWLYAVTGRHCLSVGPEGIAVFRGDHPLQTLPWDDIKSVELVRGEPVWKIWTAIRSGGYGLPYLIVTETSKARMLPPFLAPFRSQVASLDSMVSQACLDRGVSYSAE